MLGAGRRRGPRRWGLFSGGTRSPSPLGSVRPQQGPDKQLLWWSHWVLPLQRRARTPGPGAGCGVARGCFFTPTGTRLLLQARRESRQWAQQNSHRGQGKPTEGTKTGVDI